MLKKGLVLGLVAMMAAGCINGGEKPQVISQAEYVNKMNGGWLGQIAGVTWGASTEFCYLNRTVPDAEFPKWKPEMINGCFYQDDIYVEMTFLKTLMDYGFDVDIKQAGIDFANSGYMLWHANYFGRDNLRKGIAPPDSGHPQFNEHADDIDYQIEADYSGLIAPGMPNYAVEAGNKFGRLMNYADGVYGGQWVGAMYALAFFESDVEVILLKALEYIPQESGYYECIMDTVDAYHRNPDNWKAAWREITDKYHVDESNRKFTCCHGADYVNIDAKLNGAYIAMGLLYGGGDLDKTIFISTACGQDSDCNPANAAGVVGTIIGFDNMPEKFKGKLNLTRKFDFTDYNFPELINVCQTLAEKLVVRYGGTVKTVNGQVVYQIPEQLPRPDKVEFSHAPGPIANSVYTDAERAKIYGKDPVAEVEERMPLELGLTGTFPGWQVRDCGKEMSPGLAENWQGRTKVLVTHPLDQNTPCVLYRTIAVAKDKKTHLNLAVGRHPSGDFQLIVKGNSQVLLDVPVEIENTDENGYLEVSVDLSRFAGESVELELLNMPSGWLFEAAYWNKIAITEE